MAVRMKCSLGAAITLKSWRLRLLLHLLMGLLKLACHEPRQRPIDIINILKKKLAPMFAHRVEELNIEHVTSVRDWDSELPDAVKLYGAYRRRKADQDGSTVIPHSFTFVRRESYLFRNHSHSSVTISMMSFFISKFKP